MFKILLVSLLLFPTLGLCEFKVAALYWSENIEGQVIMRYGLEEVITNYNKKAKRKIELIAHVAGDGKEGILRQKKQFQKVIDDGVDLIVIQPTDNSVLSSELKSANKKKIPVIAYDQYILNGKLLSFITSDNYQAGELNAQYIDSLFDDERKIKIILVEYPVVSSTVERVDGFFDTLKKGHQKFEVLKSYRAVEPIAGKKVGKQILKDFPKKGSFDVLFTVNDGGGLSIVDELKKARRFEVIGASVDGDPSSVDNIKEGNITKIDSAQFCAEIGRQSAYQAINYLTGKKVHEKVFVPTFPITKDTLDIYPGWRGSLPKSFKKPWSESNFWKGKIKTK